MKKKQLIWKKHGPDFWAVQGYLHPQITIERKDYGFELYYRGRQDAKFSFMSLKTAMGVAQLMHDDQY